MVYISSVFGIVGLFGCSCVEFKLMLNHVFFQLCH